MKIEIEKSPRRERYAYGRRSIVSPLSPHAGIQSVIECDYDPQGWIFWKKKETVSCRLSRHAAGRWLSRDPIEEQGGRNLYAYANGNPLCESDWLGQAPKDKRYGLPDEFWRWYHRQVKRPGDKDITKEEADDLYDEWKKSGKPNGEGSKTEKENKMVICPGEPAPSPAAALNWLEVSGLVAIGVSIILVDIVTIPSGEGACGVAIITWALAN